MLQSFLENVLLIGHDKLSLFPRASVNFLVAHFKLLSRTQGLTDLTFVER